jgi:hypothetical protein
MLFNKHSRLSKLLLFVYIVCLCWVSDIGYILLKLITLGKVKIPKHSSLLSRNASLSGVSFFRKLAIIFRSVIVDFFYFVLGTIFLLLIIRLLIVFYVSHWGPIPPIHEWR